MWLRRYGLDQEPVLSYYPFPGSPRALTERLVADAKATAGQSTEQMEANQRVLSFTNGVNSLFAHDCC